MSEDRALDAQVAERVMGWRRTGDKDMTSPLHRNIPIEEGQWFVADVWDSKGPHPRLESPTGESLYFCPCQSRKGIEPPPYSTDPAACALVEAEIARRQAQWDAIPDGQAPLSTYIQELMAIVCPEGEKAARGLWLLSWRDIATVLTAPPEARCRAALVAVGTGAPDTFPDAGGTLGANWTRRGRG